MSFLWYWPAGGWDFDAWKKKQDWTPIQSEQSGHPEFVPLVTPGMTLAQWRPEAMKWRKVSDQILGTLSDGAPTQFKYEALGAVYRTDKYSMQRYRYTLTDEEWGYAWLLLPTKRVIEDASVIALHQTACSGKNEPVGIDFTPDERSGVYYAAELAERGFVTLAPDAIAFGERQSGHRNAKYRSADEFFTAQPHGSVMGKMAFDTSRAVDLLQQHPQIKSKRIGCVGHSHGGYGTLFGMLADPRINAGVISCGMNTFRDDTSPDRWWERTALIPRVGLYDDGKGTGMSATPIDFHTWVALIAPRPLTIIAGANDAIFENCAPLEERLKLSKAVYDLHNAGGELNVKVYPGPHSFNDDARHAAYEMLVKKLAS